MAAEYNINKRPKDDIDDDEKKHVHKDDKDVIYVPS
eukprot:CAMPEP_0201590430 /NCGR_PEP_ID=MMETSP0190_2-20130828/177684_1 /ASSEMBLY_ACC=CAM_ASM_000263 /TAXON_ID=37353 /ORGANISM="Rosalina sp." /LENGTH=35 /DNA_ID= /DNA_START= /DNA_END= /DNA_ORIENTATION=